MTLSQGRKPNDTAFARFPWTRRPKGKARLRLKLLLDPNDTRTLKKAMKRLSRRELATFGRDTLSDYVRYACRDDGDTLCVARRAALLVLLDGQEARDGRL